MNRRWRRGVIGEGRGESEIEEERRRSAMEWEEEVVKRRGQITRLEIKCYFFMNKKRLFLFMAFCRIQFIIKGICHFLGIFILWTKKGR